MKNKEKFYSTVFASLALVLLFVILASSTASASSGQNSSRATPYAYITNSGDDNVSVIDTANNTVVANVTVGVYPFGVAVSPDGKKVYVTNEFDSNVSVIDTATNSVVANVTVIDQNHIPKGVAVSPDGTKVYVASELNGIVPLSEKNFDAVSVIDTATNNVTATVQVGSLPFGIAVNPDGKKVYVANEFDSNVSVIDTAINNVTDIIPVGNSPQGVAVAGTKVYVTNSGDDNVSVIDTATNNVTATVPVGTGPTGVAVSPDGTKAYVTNHGNSEAPDDTVSVIDTATNNVTATVPVGVGPFGVAVSPDGTKVYVANKFDSNVSIIDTATNKVISSVIVGDSPVAFGKFIGEKTAPTICNASTIYGYNFDNSRYNNKMDIREAGLSNMTINLNGYDTCEGKLISTRTKTNSTGYFAFEDIRPGVYVISESFVIGLLPSTDAAYTLIIPSNSTSIRKDFGNIKLSNKQTKTD